MTAAAQRSENIKNIDAERARNQSVVEAMQSLHDDQQRRKVEDAKCKKDMSLEMAKMAAEMDRLALEASTKQMEVNADISALLGKLASKDIEAEQVGQTVASLQICMKTLGKVKTTFQQSRLFWSQVTDQASLLADAQQMATVVGKRELEKVRDVMIESAQGWAAMGLLNHRASGHLERVVQKADEIMNDLPDGNETASKIRAEATQLQAKVKEEDVKLAGLVNERSTVAIVEVDESNSVDDPLEIVEVDENDAVHEDDDH